MGVSTKFVKECIRVFVFAFVGAFLPLVTGILSAPNWDVAKAALVSAIVAAVTVAGKAVLDFLTKGVSPAPSVGILPSSVKE